MPYEVRLNYLHLIRYTSIEVNTYLLYPYLSFQDLRFFDPGIQYPWLSPKSLRAWHSFDLTPPISVLLTMFNTSNTQDHDPDILQMGLVVSDAEAEGNDGFNEKMDSDHDGSGNPPLIDPSSNDSTPQRSAVADVLLGLNEPITFTFGSSLPPLTTNHDRINHLERRSEEQPVITRRLLSSNSIPIDRMIMNNDTPTGSREIHYCMLHILSLMANLSSHLLRYDDVVSASSDGIVQDEHIFVSQWFNETNHLHGILESS